MYNKGSGERGLLRLKAFTPANFDSFQNEHDIARPEEA